MTGLGHLNIKTPAYMTVRLTSLVDNRYLITLCLCPCAHVLWPVDAYIKSCKLTVTKVRVGNKRDFDYIEMGEFLLLKS